MKLKIVFNAVVVLAIVPVEGFWRMPCLARAGLARIDPLVSFGKVSDHAHAIHGSSGFSPTANTADLVNGSCTSCQVAQDKSAYWTPPLYFEDDSTNEYTLVPQVGGMLAYYLLYGSEAKPTVTAFPDGFQMVAGDTNQRNFTYPVPDLPKSFWNVAPYNTQEFLRQAALGFNCLNYQKAPEGSLMRHFLPNKTFVDENCADGIRFELMFPSCWNGKDITSKNHKNHVAYPSEVMDGDCPEGFPVRLPSLFYETIWDTTAFVEKEGRFVVANGDPTGFGYHGDFITGWSSVSFLQSAVDTCTNLSGEIEDCSLFEIQDPSVYGNCNITLPTSLQTEDFVGPIKTLPGNPAIDDGPAYVSENTNTVESSAVLIDEDLGANKSLDTFYPASYMTIAPPSTVLTTPNYKAQTSYTTSDGNLIKVVIMVIEEVVTIVGSPTATTTITVSPSAKELTTNVRRGLIEESHPYVHPRSQHHHTRDYEHGGMSYLHPYAPQKIGHGLLA